MPAFRTLVGTTSSAFAVLGRTSFGAPCRGSFPKWKPPKLGNLEALKCSKRACEQCRPSTPGTSNLLFLSDVWRAGTCSNSLFHRTCPDPRALTQKRRSESRKLQEQTTSDELAELGSWTRDWHGAQRPDYDWAAPEG
eukprot:10819097-Alexandrium_andersonii.AAC.1